MVQRKLTLQLHHAQTQSFPHHHDAKSPRGADLKAKKMKKSGSPPLCKTTMPNYMKSTTSSAARKEQSQSSKPSSPSPKRPTKKPSFKPERQYCNPVLKFGSVDAKRATCSSTLKGSKFPAFLSLNPSGHSAVKVCPYTYCSLNGHHHPPLSSFLSAARRRTQAPAAREDDDDDFFVEIYMAGTAAQDQEERVSEEFSQDSFDGSDMDWEIGYGSLLQYDYEADDAVEIKDEVVEGKVCCFDEIVVDEAAQESVDEDGGFNSDAFSGSGDGEFESTDDLQISAPIQQVLVQEKKETKDEENHIFSEYNNTPTKSDVQDHEEAASFDDLDHDCLPNKEAIAVAVEESDEAEHGIFREGRGQIEIAEDITALLQFAANSKKVVEEDGDELGGFNPRGPNFLPVEGDPEAERVDLRHQDLDERRNSEEWMVDYALRQVVTKLGPAKKRKVALLVEAFEKVTPLPPTKFDLHLTHASQFDLPRPMQACS